jgi:hypothetical protein
MSTPITYTLYKAGEYVVLANNDPYLNVQTITGVEECFADTGVGTILKKEFRYSTDSTTFSEFQEINTANLTVIGSFDTVYFQFRFILLSGGPITIQKAGILYTPKAIDPFDNYVAPNKADDSRVYAFPITYKSNFLWEPYKMNRAIRLYKDLNLMVNNLFGHDTIYYRALPQGRSKDVILMEYSLYEHDEGQCVKVIVPNNEFPDNKLNMGPFGQDFELPFEVQVDKDYFQKIFGEGTGPQKRDVVYIQKTGRIYEVSSSYLFRDFMNEPLYFKVTLIKWLPKSSAEQSETLNTLESFTVSATKLFGEEKHDEEIKITNPQQFNIATTTEDPVRSYLDNKLEIKEEKVLNYYTLISEFHYNLQNLALKDTIKVKLDYTNLVKNTTYYARFAPESTQSDIQWYYSMKKFIYKGQSLDGYSIFDHYKGNSQVESLYFTSQIFYNASLFFLYDTEYDNEATLTPIVSCDTTPVNQFKGRIVQYKGSTCFTQNEDKSYSAWYRMTDNPQAKLRTTVSFDMYTREVTVTLSRDAVYFVGDTVDFTRVSASEFYMFGVVTEVLSKNSLRIEIPQYILDFVQGTFGTWPTYTDIQVQRSLPRVFLDSLYNDKGLKIESFGYRHFRITMNSVITYFSIANNQPGLEKNKWYGLFINFSNMFKQLTLNVWKMQWDSSTNLPSTTELTLVYNKTTPMIREDRTSEVSFTLNPSFMDLTNVRLFNKVAETDKQTIVLNQNIVKDAQLAIIIDNALPASKLPYIGYTH